MNYIKDISEMEFDREIKGSDGAAVLEFWVRSCDQCRRFKPVYEKLPEMIGKARFYRMIMLKTMENLRLAEGMGWRRRPRRRSSAAAARLAGYSGACPSKKQ